MNSENSRLDTCANHSDLSMKLDLRVLKNKEMNFEDSLQDQHSKLSMFDLCNTHERLSSEEFFKENLHQSTISEKKSSNLD